MKLTVSFVKGKKSESSVYHNNRSIEKNFNFEKEGHQHIRKEETKNNKILIHRNLDHVYNLAFSKVIQKYNVKNRKKHPERCFNGISESRKKANIELYSSLHGFLKENKKEQKETLERLESTDNAEIVDFFEKNQFMSLSEARHKLSEVKHEETFGQVIHKKMKHDKTTVAQTEFILQIGNASDFNVTDEQGFFLDKNGKRIKNDKGKEIGKGATSDEIKSITPYLVRKNPELWKKSEKVLEKSLKDFQKRNKHFLVYNAVLHLDEASPHIHMNCVPVALGYKRGLEARVSINKTLDNEGFKYSRNDNKAQFKAFQHVQADAIAKIMKQETGIERKQGVTNSYKDIHEYKEAQRAIEDKKAEIEKLNNEIAEKREQVVMQNATFESNQNTLNSQETQINANRDVLSKYNTSISNAQNKLKTTQNTLKTQNTLIMQNKPKLDVLNNYDTLLTTTQNALKTAENKRKQEEDARDIAEQQKENAEKARDKARKEAEAVNANYLARLNAREQALNTKDRNLTARKNKLNKSIINFNNRVYGWIDQNGKKHIGLNEFSRNLKKREDDLNKRENSFKKLVTSFADNFKRNYIEYGINQNFKFMQKYCYKNNVFDQTLYNNVVKNFMHNKKLHEPIDNAVFNGKVEKHSYPRFKAFVHAIKATMSGHNELDDIVELADNVDNALSPQVKDLPNMKPIDLYKDEDDDLKF